MYQDLNYGFEIETVGVHLHKIMNMMNDLLAPIKTIHVCRHNKELGCWAVHAEEQLHPNYGEPTCEVKSRLNPTKEETKKVILLLKELGCRTTRYCGMHVHVSHPTLPVRAKLPPVEIWETRLKQVKAKEHTTLCTKSRGVSQVNDKHVEVRVFNTYIDPDLVQANIDLTLNSIHLEATDNDWLSIPVEYEMKYPSKVTASMNVSP